jgi:hypothetical protein
MSNGIKPGGLLSIFSGIAFVLYMLVIAGYLTNWDGTTAALPTWAALVFPAIAFVRPCSLLGIWLWSRMGLTTNIVCTCIEILSLLVLGLKVNYPNLAVTVILTALVWPKWRYMTWGVSAHPNSPANKS